MALCDEERFNNAFYLLKKTVEFLSSEYDMHFVILSAYQSSKSHSVVAYTSPGPAAKFFDDSSTLQQNGAAGKAIIHKWDSFAKNHCFHTSNTAQAHSFSNTPSYTEFIKSDLSDVIATTQQSNAMNTASSSAAATSAANCNSSNSAMTGVGSNGARCPSPSNTLLSELLPEPPTKILSETMYYCNGEFKSEDTENEDENIKSGTPSPNENDVYGGGKDSGFRRGGKSGSHNGAHGLKRKSLQAVSDQLAKKAVAVNYYRPIYPAAPKLVTPTISTACDSAVLNLSNSFLRNNNSSVSAQDLSSVKPLLVSSLLSQSTYPLNNQSQNVAASISPSSAASNNNNITKATLNNSASSKCGIKVPSVNGVKNTSSDSTSTNFSTTTSNGKKSSSKSPNLTSPMKSSSLNSNGTPKQTWPCTVCSKDFASQSTMKRHLNHFHLKVHSYTCSYCQEVFYRKDKLVAHIKIKHGIDTSRSARLLTQTKTSPNGSTITNSTLSPVSPTSSNNSNSVSGTNGNSALSPAELSPNSADGYKEEPMTPPSGMLSPPELTPAAATVAAV